MCGFAGFFDPRQRAPRSQWFGILERMGAKIARRGPDSSDMLVLEQHGLAMIHHRLAIQDLSAAGRQPMVSEDNRYYMVFNGEIYNHLALRQQLQKVADKQINWQGHSDTETLMQLITYYDFSDVLEKLVGMFAIAVYDKNQKRFLFAVDRFAEKPLYIYFKNNLLLFASQSKAFKPHPCFDKAINLSSVSCLLKYNYIQAPASIYQNAYRLEPGTFLQLNERDLLNNNFIPATHKYWQLATSISEPGGYPNDVNTIVRGTEEKLTASISSQLLSDVPVGAYLSGGIDSSTVVALMSKISKKPVKTFTIGFGNADYDEAVYARKIAKHLNTEHFETYIEPNTSLDIINDMYDIYDEPFSDASQIPTTIISKLTSQQVKVVLSGDGADEVFAGYNRYVWVDKIWKIIQLSPKLMSSVFNTIPSLLYQTGANRHSQRLQQLMQKIFNVSQPLEKLHKLAVLMPATTREMLYHNCLATWRDPGHALIESHRSPDIIASHSAAASFNDFTTLMMYIDTNTYLSGDILTKVDRASMHYGLETRVPYLNHDLVEYLWRIPISYKLRAGETKWILRQILKKYIPEKYFTRPKAGFAVPLQHWLRNELRDWAQQLLCPKKLQQEGIFNPKAIHSKFNQHLSGKYNWHDYLWSVLMFQLWYDNH